MKDNQKYADYRSVADDVKVRVFLNFSIDANLSFWWSIFSHRNVTTLKFALFSCNDLIKHFSPICTGIPNSSLYSVMIRELMLDLLISSKQFWRHVSRGFVMWEDPPQTPKHRTATLLKLNWVIEMVTTTHSPGFNVLPSRWLSTCYSIRIALCLLALFR